MDLEALGRPDLGETFAGRYITASGDETLSVLQPLHRAFRAFVRGKVESIGAHAPEVPAAERQRLADSAARYFRLASDYARRRRGSALVLLAGLSGTGKSTVGGMLAGRTGAAYVFSDAVRKRLAGIDPRKHIEEQYREGLYGPEMSARTYEAMREHAAEHLDAGRLVILDATHQRAEDRRGAIELARARGVPAFVVELRLDDEAARARIAARARDPLRTSDATTAIFEQQRLAFEPVTPDEGATHLVLDASRPPYELALEVAEALPEKQGT
jgi:hypothetical protein